MKCSVLNIPFKNFCCGCGAVIEANKDKTYILSEICGITGSIHFCEKCIDKISSLKEKKVNE